MGDHIHFHSSLRVVGSHSSKEDLFASVEVDHLLQMVLCCQVAYRFASGARSLGDRSREGVLVRWGMLCRWALELTTFSVWLVSAARGDSEGEIG